MSDLNTLNRIEKQLKELEDSLNQERTPESLNLIETQLNKLQDTLNQRKTRKTYEHYINEIDAHKEFIGKCFKEGNKDKYIRVLSSKSSNQFRLECMCFEFPITFNEKHYTKQVFAPEIAFSTINFNGIHVEDYPLLCFSYGYKPTILPSLIEISEDEYFKQMHRYVDELEKEICSGSFDTSKNNKSMFDD